MLMDTDEFLVRRNGTPSLKKILTPLDNNIHTIIMTGFWAGCNKIGRKEIFTLQNLKKIKKRSNKNCMNKLIVRAKQHVFTNCIHNPYPTGGKIAKLSSTIYFFHLYTASAKNRPCDCAIYCNVADRSFQESWR